MKPREEWPDVLLMLGDQVYADEVSPATRAFIETRRDMSEPPGDVVLDFEEYTHLYHESWSDPAIRWLLSTVSTMMIFDDHDVHDDWNISEAWLEEARSHHWWNDWGMEQGVDDYDNSIGKNSDLYNRYVKKFTDQEDQVEKHRDAIRELVSKITKAQQSLDEYLMGLKVS